MLAPTEKKPGAIYTARCRARQKAGKILLRPEVDEAAFAVAAVAHNLLDPNLADQPAALNAAAQTLLVQFCECNVLPEVDRISASVKIGLLLKALRNIRKRSTKRHGRNYPASAAARGSRRRS